MSTQKKIVLLALFCLLWYATSANDGGLPFVPTPTTGEVSVLILEETADRPRLPESQLEILMSTELREWAKSHCDKGSDGTPEFRVLDKDIDTTYMTPKWRDKIAEAKSRAMPYLAVSNGKRGAEGDLPLTLAEVKEVLRRYAGE